MNKSYQASNFSAFCQSSNSLVISSNNPSQSENSLDSETHCVACDGVWMSRLRVGRGHLPALLSILMGLDDNAGSVALIPCVICSENGLRMRDPPLNVMF